ncbi:MAG: hypothetical protein P4M11_15165 [Candidatus Pacebacteria bacterium]|nr:hypothetical protein [Candidatus Paceibacterota bacterium]
MGIFAGTLAFSLVVFMAILTLIYALESAKGHLFRLFLEVPSECLKLFYARSEAFANSLAGTSHGDAESVQDSEAGSDVDKLTEIDDFSGRCILPLYDATW